MRQGNKEIKMILRLSLQFDEPGMSSLDRDVNLKITDLPILREIMAPIDVPSPDTDVYAYMLCTPKHARERITRMRSELASTLAKHLAHMIVESLSMKDTEMGYIKNQEKIDG